MANPFPISAALAAALLLSDHGWAGDPLADPPGNFVPPPSYSRWIIWTPQLHRLRVEHHVPLALVGGA